MIAVDHANNNSFENCRNWAVFEFGGAAGVEGDVDGDIPKLGVVCGASAGVCCVMGSSFGVPVEDGAATKAQLLVFEVRASAVANLVTYLMTSALVKRTLKVAVRFPT